MLALHAIRILVGVPHLLAGRTAFAIVMSFWATCAVAQPSPGQPVAGQTPSGQSQSQQDLAAVMGEVEQLDKAGRGAEALTLAERAVALAEKAHGRAHPEVAAPLLALARLLRNQNRRNDAEPLAQRALDIRIARHGPDHPETATALAGMAAQHHVQGRINEAETAHRRALALREKAFGAEHTEVASSLHALAGFLHARGRYGEAEPLYLRALTLREKLLGANDRDIAATLSNLGLLHLTLGRLIEAETNIQRALSILETAVGQSHPLYAAAMNDLAGVYEQQGRYANAEPLFAEVLVRREALRGPDHVDVALSLNNLALLYLHQGRFAEAEPLLRRALAINEKALGPDHQAVARSLNNLAGLYDRQARYSEAEPLYRRALAAREKTLGPEHPAVANSLSNLALLLSTEGRHLDAEPLYKRALAIHEKALGANHPEVATALINLASLYGAQDRVSEAEPLARRALAIREGALGAEHPSVGEVLLNLGGLLARAKKFSEAEPLFKRSLTILERAHGPEHPTIAVVLESLALAAEKQGRGDDAKVYRARVADMPAWDVADITVVYATSRRRDTSRPSPVYGDDQLLDTGEMGLGRVVIRAPKSEVVNRADRGAGALGRLDKAGGRQTNEATLKIHRVDVAGETRDGLWAYSRGRVGRAARFPKQAILYVHGYNNSFEDAARRTAMIAYDLDFDGLVATFAWPARSGVTGYMGDRDRAQTAAPFLLHMLETLGAALPDVKVHLIAHSTGAEVVLNALERLADRSTNGRRALLGEVIFAHADVTPSRLSQVMPSLSRLDVRVTSYSSREDWAMRASDWLRRDGVRVGGAPIYLTGVEAIDMSGLGGRFALNHNIFVQNPVVFGDMARLMATGLRPPNKRTPALAVESTPKGTHWAFKGPQAQAGSSPAKP